MRYDRDRLNEFEGRIAMLEAKSAEHSTALQEIKAKLDEFSRVNAALHAAVKVVGVAWTVVVMLVEVWAHAH